MEENQLLDPSPETTPRFVGSEEQGQRGRHKAVNEKAERKVDEMPVSQSARAPGAV